MSERTFKVDSPHMRGDDIAAFQRTLNKQFERWGWDHQIKTDGVYGVGTRSAAAQVVYGLGFSKKIMAEGITPELRVKIRGRKRNKTELRAFRSRAGWRREQKLRYSPRIARPLRKVTADSWGWTPPQHDGIDLICPEAAPIFAMVRARVTRADNGGWWGKSPSGDVSKGDGIVILQALETVGPIKKGMNLCYGHAERLTVQEGDIVKAGEQIGRAGLAVAWHIHFMVNVGEGTRGVGDRDPEPIYRYAMKNGV